VDNIEATESLITSKPSSPKTSALTLKVPYSAAGKSASQSPTTSPNNVLKVTSAKSHKKETTSLSLLVETSILIQKEGLKDCQDASISCLCEHGSGR
jgi:hypothetical protein